MHICVSCGIVFECDRNTHLYMQSKPELKVDTFSRAAAQTVIASECC